MANRIALVMGVKTRMGYISLISSNGPAIRQKSDENLRLNRIRLVTTELRTFTRAAKKIFS
ncbi:MULTISPECIES: hypothetical protein [Pseudomonas]|uniref:Uncharacterized protein n=1 Tax=Pseudomonas donghuensis TaxID=1163398 RepID=A0AAQ0IN29_9PSED|nr:MULTISPECIES: hypothetical protein [Pseudomonas]MDF9892332.1 hypothetical protein [Pseudomonas vranovensis]MBS7599992.1 hypothetical protein [Pseudomonas sp. RC2C2]MCP6694386.1 hypothetical protein [Pseudomonas donghuensis]MCP6695640.1 hypothetical protein [Pseudomonas donghuensis]QWE81221.1 hypothetical protein BV82_07620 [Pseudomonas donghuensis]